MQGVWYAAVGALFVLGLLLVFVYSKRTATGQHVARATARDATGLGTASDSTDESTAVRRAAEVEAEATRRAALAEARSITAEAESVRAAAEQRAADIVARAEREGAAAAQGREAELRGLAAQLADKQQQLERTAASLDSESARVAAGAKELAEADQELASRRRELDATGAQLQAREAELAARAAEHTRELERIACLSAEEAKAELMSTVEAAARRDAAVLTRSIENEARAEGTERARAIVVEAVQRVASEQTTETVVSVLHLPSDDMKGRIIGREGRNIRAFESVTGVNVLIDDTPEAVLLSCFDPVRREVGRLTLEKLILDGRIHPQRIEETYEQSRLEVDELCLRAARDALAEVGVSQLDERLLPTLGRLKYRTSYGQNVLGHLIETAHLAGVMAAELGIEPTLVKRCAFLHDIGKALTHEVEGSHAIIGAELLRKYGEDERVVHAVEAHHNEVQPRTIEAVLTQASDTCSAARPGARRESLESYDKRLERIEAIASGREGVEKVFAMQSGREVRVMVEPAEVDDLAASVIAREIAKQIEDELTYPGQIRVTVVRETRSTEIAH
jgi:ribonuclease Y